MPLQAVSERVMAVAQLVKTADLWPYREYDRKVKMDLHDAITFKGWTEPLVLTYYAKTGTARLGEGNHRLRVAHEFGWKYVPVQVVRNDTTDPDSKWAMDYGMRRSVPVPMPPAPDRFGYVAARSMEELGFDVVPWSEVLRQ